MKTKSSEIATFLMSSVLMLMALLCLQRPIRADLIKAPQDTEALNDTLTFFNCSSTLHSSTIQWFHYRLVDHENRQIVYGYDQFHWPYQSRFRIERNDTTGQSNLVIDPVSVEDAGKFECQDDKGRGANGFAELSVLESPPLCLHSSCTVDFRGNVPPAMIWKRSGSNEGAKATQIIVSPTRAVYTLEENYDFEGQSFECETTKSVAMQLSCSSDLPKSEKVNMFVLIPIVGFVIAMIVGLLIGGICLKKRRDRRKQSNQLNALKPDSEPEQESTAMSNQGNTPAKTVNQSLPIGLPKPELHQASSANRTQTNTPIRGSTRNEDAPKDQQGKVKKLVAKFDQLESETEMGEPLLSERDASDLQTRQTADGTKVKNLDISQVSGHSGSAIHGGTSYSESKSPTTQPTEEQSNDFSRNLAFFGKNKTVPPPPGKDFATPKGTQTADARKPNGQQELQMSKHNSGLGEGNATQSETQSIADETVGGDPGEQQNLEKEDLLPEVNDSQSENQHTAEDKEQAEQTNTNAESEHLLN